VKLRVLFKGDEEKFRRMAMKRFRYGKGSLSKRWRRFCAIELGITGLL